jgi:hypothetical protein
VIRAARVLSNLEEIVLFKEAAIASGMSGVRIRTPRKKIIEKYKLNI